MSYIFDAASGESSIERAWQTHEVTGVVYVATLLRRRISLESLQRRSWSLLSSLTGRDIACRSAHVLPLRRPRSTRCDHNRDYP